ncbi:MAG: hypothetical protein AB2L18_01585 [Anaerolineaceae bacterium]
MSFPNINHKSGLNYINPNWFIQNGSNLLTYSKNRYEQDGPGAVFINIDIANFSIDYFSLDRIDLEIREKINSIAFEYNPKREFIIVLGEKSDYIYLISVN